MIPRPPRTTRTDTLCPYQTPFRSRRIRRSTGTREAAMTRLPLTPSRSVAGRLGLVLLAAALLACCADSIAGKGFDEAAQTAGTALGRQPVWIRSDEDRAKAQARVAALLQKPLDPDDAVEIALLNNRGLQARYAELGLSAADLAQASRLPNPGFSLRSEARRVGKECVSTCRSRWSPAH